MGVMREVLTSLLGVMKEGITRPLSAMEEVVTRLMGVIEEVVTRPLGVMEEVVTRPLGVIEEVVTRPLGVMKEVVTRPLSVLEEVMLSWFVRATSLSHTFVVLLDKTFSLLSCEFHEYGYTWIKPEEKYFLLPVKCSENILPLRPYLQDSQPFVKANSDHCYSQE